MPLIFAVLKGQEETVKLLLSQDTTDINCKDI